MLKQNVRVPVARELDLGKADLDADSALRRIVKGRERGKKKKKKKKRESTQSSLEIKTQIVIATPLSLDRGILPDSTRT